MNRFLKPQALLFGLLLCAAGLYAQGPGAQAAPEKDPQVPEARQLSQACVSISARERQFFAEVALLGREQIALGKVALRHGARPDVRKLAQQSINAYIRMAAQLTTLAEAKGVILPSEPTQRQTEAHTHLASLTGQAFDGAYLTLLARSQRSLSALFAEQAQGPGDRQLTTWAQNAIPQLESHSKRLAAVHSAGQALRLAEDEP